MSSLVVMSKGTKFTQQSYKVSDSFPFEWIKKKWREAFHVTAMATSGTQWAVVMSRGAGFLDQVCPCALLLLSIVDQHPTPLLEQYTGRCPPWRCGFNAPLTQPNLCLPRLPPSSMQPGPPIPQPWRPPNAPGFSDVPWPPHFRAV